MYSSSLTCRKLRGKPELQIMADLPTDRVEPSPPFTNVVVDAFGPWTIVSRRTRGGYAIIFNTNGYEYVWLINTL
jgi:hypothetical protein